MKCHLKIIWYEKRVRGFYQKKKCVKNIEKHYFREQGISIHTHCPYLWHYFILSNFTSFIISVSIFMIYFCLIYCCYSVLKYDPYFLALFICGNIIFSKIMEINFQKTENKVAKNHGCLFLQKDKS